MIAAAELAGLLARLCPPAGIDLAGAASLPCRLPHAGAFLDWLRTGRHGGLAYMARGPEERLAPERQRPWARSVLVFGQRYTDGWGRADRSPWDGATAPRPWTDGVARYARGADYHGVLEAGVRAVIAGLRAATCAFRCHVAVDTGPYLEREYAWLAGLGFLGKNTCLINERLGSGLFLGVAVCELVIEGLPPAGTPALAPLWSVSPRPGTRPGGGTAAPADPPATRCGSCRACVDACPTGALDRPFTLDANRCLSTWTIEWRGMPPAGERHRQGGLVFGCDICQAVCPWNTSAAAQPPPRAEYAVAGAHAELELGDLLALSPEEFRRRFRHTPLWRAHAGGLRRNAIAAAANTARTDLMSRLAAIEAGDPEPQTRAAAAWALRMLAGRGAR